MDERDKKIGFKISEPTFPKAEDITMNDVWGEIDLNKMEFVRKGMIVARGYGNLSDAERDNASDIMYPEICPIWNEKLSYKSVTIICPKEQYNQVYYWLEYVHGSGCVSKIKDLEGNKVAFRSDYMCW